MARTFKPALFVTVSASSLLACSGISEKLGGASTDGMNISHNPPCCEDGKATFPTGPFTAGQQLEARDSQHREIHHGNGTCWVDLPYAEPPTSWRPPPTQAVDCPPAMANDPAWAECSGGSISIKALSPALSCVCYFDGNPPPSPKEVACPVASVPGLLAAAADANPPTMNPPPPPPEVEPPSIPEVPLPPPIGNPPRPMPG